MKEAISKAAEGLYFISESEYPLEYVSFQSGKDLQEQLRALSTHKDGKIEIQTLSYFFRNMTKELVGEDPATPLRFRDLQKVLEQHLKDIKVYRIGEVQVDAFIIGKNEKGEFSGLRTHLIET